MEWITVKRKELSFSWLEISAGRAGEDLLLCVQGGEQPHLGSVVQAVPRPSLSGDGSVSCTSSVLNLTGHKDEALCRRLAEKICCYFGKVTVCTGGFHVDGITGEQLQELQGALEKLECQVVTELENTACR